VAARRYNNNNNNEDLRRAVEDAFRTVTPKNKKCSERMSQRDMEGASVCVSSIKVAHTDSLDM
jgi:hypothetical protein